MILIIIAITVAVSVLAFSKKELMYKLQFNAYQIIRRKEWYRLFTHAVLHADIGHLAINMIVLYSFGRGIEMYFRYYLGGNTSFYIILFYISSIIASELYSLIKNRDNPHYNAVGASGAVSAVVFAAIFFSPYDKVLLLGVLPIPGILFGALYLIYSGVMSKRSKDNVAHDVHFWGAVYGFIFPLIIRPELIYLFLEKISNI